MASIREIKEGRQEQGADEEITYTATIPTTWGTPTGTPTVTGESFNGSSYTVVTSTIFPTGSASIVGQVITLPECKAMTADTTYRVHVKFNKSEGGVESFYAWIECKK